MERWKKIPDYPYSVSNMGRVRRDAGGNNTWSGRILKRTLNDKGYLQVGLYKNGICRIKQIHLLVAQAFIPNPQNLPIVNHLDENKANPVASNLVWSTYPDNIKWSLAAKLARLKFPF